MPPPAKRTASPPTTISDLGDDLLREILVRLPALPSLVRAALACRAFLRAVRSSSSDFRRRFRALTVLGFFINGGRSSMPAFVPLRRRNDSDLAAAVRGGDFFLTRLPDHGQGDGYIDAGDDDDGWQVKGCRDAYVLLVNRIAHQVAAYNPLTRTMDLFPQPPVDEISGKFFEEFHIFSDEENPGSFRVFGIYRHGGSHVAIFSSDSRRWQALAWPEPPMPGSWPECIGGVGNKFIYWRHVAKPYMTVLSTETLHLSRMDLPPALRLKVSGKGYSHRSTITAGETKDGDPCIFEVCRDRLYVWQWTSGDDGVGSWARERIHFSFKEEDHVWDPWEDRFAQKSPRVPDVVTVAAAVRGFVYLYTNKHPCSFMSLCLQTGELSKLKRCDRTSKYQKLHPYAMAWPPLFADPNIV